MYFEPIINTKIQLEKMGWLVNKHQDGQHVDIDTKGLPKTEEFAAALLSDGFMSLSKCWRLHHLNLALGRSFGSTGIGLRPMST
ncbi:hypothetical protein ACFSJQ_19170 [Vibrio olivae]